MPIDAIATPVTETAQDFRIAEARWPADRGAVEMLFREYVDSLGFDISFQDVTTEFSSLPGKYARPAGVVLLAWNGSEPAGVVAFRMHEPGICEMKRLYVRPAYRGWGLGRELAIELIDQARAAGYRTMVLDTVTSLAAAQNLYEALGFEKIEAYCHNPLPGATFMALEL